jgi:hypothetical protein
MLKYDRTTRTAASRASRADAMVAGRKRRLEEANARDRKQPKLAFRPLAPRESDPAKATHAPVEGLAVDTASARVLSIASGFAQSTVAAVAAAPAAVRVTAVVTESDVQMDIRREHAPSGEAEAGVGTGVGAAFVTVAPAIGDSAGPVANDNGDVGNAELEIADGTDGLGHAPPCAEDIAAAAGGEGQDVRSERSIDETTRPAPVQVAASAPVVASAAMQTERHAQELGPVDESVEGDSMASDGAEEVDKQESSVEKGAVVASTAADDAVKQGIVRQWPKGGISKKDTAVKGYWFYHPKHGVSKHMGRGMWSCTHGRVHNQCKECDGASICEHNRRRSRCKECGGGSICKHNRERSKCRECGGSSICEHNRERTKCKECGGGSICEHNRERSECKECYGASICDHNRLRSQCKECNGSKTCKGHDGGGCPNAKARVSANYDRLCVRCFIAAFPTDPRALNASRFLHARELAVRAYLEQRFPGREWAFDKGFAVGVSQRPDALMPVGEAKVIVVEVRSPLARQHLGARVDHHHCAPRDHPSGRGGE